MKSDNNINQNNVVSSNLDQGDFELFRQFLQDACGILLGENKQYLVTTRINRILSEYQISSIKELVAQLTRGSNRALRQAVVDAMTTNETLWFRDVYPFDHLKSQLLPGLMSSGRGPLRIWSAACSSGQEPYSISMAVEEYRQAAKGALARKVEIVATDLSDRVINLAQTAEYDHLSVARGLSNVRLEQFFDKLDKSTWKAKSLVTERVDFRLLNLMTPYVGLGKFDIIFCRNVLIYFSGELKRDILKRMHSALNPGGLLFLGSSEGLAGVADLFEMVHCNPGIVYRAF